MDNYMAQLSSENKSLALSNHGIALEWNYSRSIWSDAVTDDCTRSNRVRPIDQTAVESSRWIAAEPFNPATTGLKKQNKTFTFATIQS